MSKIFDPKFQESIIQKYRASYQERLEDLRIYLNEEFESTNLSNEFLEQLEKMLNDDDLKNYSPLKDHWLKLVEDVFFIADLHDDFEIAKNKREIEEEISIFWENGKFSESFFELQEDDNNILDTSSILMDMLENQILASYYLHFPNGRVKMDVPVLYTVMPELGDSEQKIYLSETHKFVDIRELPKTFPTIPIVDVMHDLDSIVFEVDEDEHGYPISNHDCEFESFKIVPKNSEIVREAIELIKNSSPELFSTIKKFVSNIVITSDQNLELLDYAYVQSKNDLPIKCVEDILQSAAKNFFRHLEFESNDEVVSVSWSKTPIVDEEFAAKLFGKLFLIKFGKVDVKSELKKDLALAEKLKIKLPLLAELQNASI